MAHNRMTNKDPYDILGVRRTASPAEIKQAYRRLAKQSHPDRNPGDKTAEQRFKEVHAAYEVLGDPQRRDQYDRFGAGGPAPDVHAWTTGRAPFEDVAFDFGDLGDLTGIFEQFFNRAPTGRARRRVGPASRPATAGRRPAPAAARGADLELEIELTFEEALRGAVRDVVLSAGPDLPREQIRFRVPPGVADGQRIRVRGKGQEGPGGRGDLMIRCRVRPHLYFRREGRDVLLDLPLTFAEATLGTQVEIPTLDGTAILTVPPGTSAGTKLRLRGRGVPDSSGEAGDMYAIVHIEAPKTLSPEARELLVTLDRALGQRPREKLGWPK